MSCRREPRVSSFSSSPTGRAAPCTVPQGRSCHPSCSGSRSPCRRRERYGLCGRNAIIRWYRWAHTGGEQAHACGHPDAHRAHLVHHRPVVDRDGDLAGAHGGGREHSETQQTCSTAGPLRIIRYPFPRCPGRSYSCSSPAKGTPSQTACRREGWCLPRSALALPIEPQRGGAPAIIVGGVGSIVLHIGVPRAGEARAVEVHIVLLLRDIPLQVKNKLLARLAVLGAPLFLEHGRKLRVVDMAAVAQLIWGIQAIQHAIWLPGIADGGEGHAVELAFVCRGHIGAVLLDLDLRLNADLFEVTLG